jgi:2-oxoglutarate dehydrogenase E2 component (dihydrolipoamide succinyltransferase)
MPQVELLLPKMGESIMEATILKWLKKEGDAVQTDESILEIATDKVDSEVPSPYAGTIVKLLYKEGDVVAVNKPIAVINTGGDVDLKPEMPSATVSKKQTSDFIDKPKISTNAPTVITSNGHNHGNGLSKFYSPLVLNIARNEGISMTELENITGTGKDNRVTKTDIFSYIENKTQSKSSSVVVSEEKNILNETKPEIEYSGNVEIVEMDRMRKMIADHMVMSKKTSPHVTSFVEADVTNMVLWREKNKNIFEKREGEKITFTPLFIDAVIKALKDFPRVNASVDGNKIIIRKDLNIGLATALQNGNLIVPVIKNADHYNLTGLTKRVNDLVNRARINKLKPDDIEGGTFTISNVGTFGNLMGTPIINQPQVAILATGAIKKKPVVLETSQGDTIAIRHMMFLSLSYDHRIVDGALGGSFLKKIADNLEAFNPNQEF